MIAHLDAADKRLDRMDRHMESPCLRITSLEHTVSGKFAAMGAGFQMVSDQLTDS